jgi:hypothetical protein
VSCASRKGRRAANAPSIPTRSAVVAKRQRLDARRGRAERVALASLSSVSACTQQRMLPLWATRLRVGWWKSETNEPKIVPCNEQ